MGIRLPSAFRAGFLCVFRKQRDTACKAVGIFVKKCFVGCLSCLLLRLLVLILCCCLPVVRKWLVVWLCKESMWKRQSSRKTRRWQKFVVLYVTWRCSNIEVVKVCIQEENFYSSFDPNHTAPWRCCWCHLDAMSHIAHCAASVYFI